MTRSLEDLFDSMFGPTAAKPAGQPTTRSRMAACEECRTSGHMYQVHGKTNPTKVSCYRCEVSWGIGPRMEPS